MSRNESMPVYDLRCVNDPSKICSVKSDIMREATGDSSGHTVIDNDLTQRLVLMKFRERDSLARGLGAECAASLEYCPTREIVEEMPIRSGFLKLARTAWYAFNRA